MIAYDVSFQYWSSISLLKKSGEHPLVFLRHASGDWGELSEEDRIENESSLVHGFRWLSSYNLGSGAKIWVITEADRSATTILLPEEY